MEFRGRREEYKSPELGIDFLNSHNLFGEGRLVSRKDSHNSGVRLRDSGILNLKLPSTHKSSSSVISDNLNNPISPGMRISTSDRGKLIEKNFTPIMAHRYIQFQLNDFYKRYKKE